VKNEDFVLVYRIENKNGYGAYQVGANWSWSGMVGPYDNAQHPQPETDSALAPFWKELTNRIDWYFGFASKEQMRAWFYADEWLQALKDAGARLSIYKVHKARFHAGHTQAIFKKGQAELVEVADLI
jgi:hypothetical protein